MPYKTGNYGDRNPFRPTNQSSIFELIGSSSQGHNRNSKKANNAPLRVVIYERCKRISFLHD